MLTTLQTMAVTLGVLNTKLDTVIENDKKRETEVDEMKKEIDGIKAKIYAMSGVIGIAVSVATSWITGQINAQ